MCLEVNRYKIDAMRESLCVVTLELALAGVADGCVVCWAVTSPLGLVQF